MIPHIPFSPALRGWELRAFSGLDRREGAPEGSLRAMRNLGGEAAPFLSSRPARRRLAELARPNGLFALGERLFTVSGTTLLLDGEPVGTVADGPKQFCALGERVLIWPDKLLWSPAGGLEPLEALYASTALSFTDGVYAGQEAAANCIHTAGPPFPFRPGDAVTVSGASDAANNKTVVIREKSADGCSLYCSENCFVPADETGRALTLSRTAPELDFVFSHENRLWGCRGDTVCCSKLGDPFNWNVFDGLSTDAWSVETGTPGAFTAACSFLGYPCFFKERRVFKVYGSRPANFELLGAATLGVRAGCEKSLAVAGETLYYLSPAGFAAYSGGLPRLADQALGPEKHVEAVAGSDGLCYVVSARLPSGAWELLRYDPARGVWLREDETRLLALCYRGGLLGLTAAGQLLLLGRGEGPPPAGSVPEGRFLSEAELPPFEAGSFGGKYPLRLWLRLGLGNAEPEEAEEPVSVTVFVAFDGGEWEEAAGLTAGLLCETDLPVPLRRCSRFALRLRADGPWTLRGLRWEVYAERSRRR